LARAGASGYNYSLIEFLYPGNYNPYAFEAIAASKDKAIDLLDREALLPGTSKVVLSRIIRLYGKIGTTNAIEKLLKTLEYDDSYLMDQTIEALYENRFQATKNDKYKILGYFVRLMGILTYNLYAYSVLSKFKKASLLSYGYLQEAELNIQNLFKLLSLIYNPNIITSIQQFFLAGSRAEISHAIELTDEYVDEDIKPLFLTIVEDISLSDKLKRLEYYFPQQKLTVKDIIISTLTYDFNLLTIYTRSCALLLLEYLKIPGYADELVFCSDHPEPIFAEAAKHVLNSYDTSIPKKKSKKLRWPKHSIQDFLSDDDHRKLMFVKYYELKKFNIFNSLSEHIALELTKVAREFELLKGQKLDIDDLSREYSILLTHVLLVNEEGKINFEFGEYFISTGLLKSKNVRHIINGGEDGVVWAFHEDTVRRLLYDNIEFANVLITSLEHFKLVTK
jgi:ATP:ADP antiporter, AAA family